MGRERFGIVLHLEQRIAAFALVHDGVERISFSALRVNTLKPGSVWHHKFSCAAQFTAHTMDGNRPHFKKTATP
jgi:hypothetical protein